MDRPEDPVGRSGFSRHLADLVCGQRAAERVPAGAGGPWRRLAPPCDPHKAFLTEQEYRERLATAAGRSDRYADAIKAGNFGGAFQAGADPTVTQRQTSLIVDPPDGRLPEMTAEGKRLSSLMRSSWALPDETPVYDSELDFDTWDRCITRGCPRRCSPSGYNNGVQIIQSPGYLILNMEMIHEARIVPIMICGGPLAPRRLRPRSGSGSAFREGDGKDTTLVIETTNYKAGASATNIGRRSPAGIAFRPASG